MKLENHEPGEKKEGKSWKWNTCDRKAQRRSWGEHEEARKGNKKKDV